jgi:hypothetical protein
MPYVGKIECYQCDHEVDVYTNVSGMAYYNCGPCGFRAQQKTQRGNDRFLTRVRKYSEPDDSPAPAAQNPAKTGPVSPAPAPQSPVISRDSREPAAKPRAGLFGGILK